MGNIVKYNTGNINKYQTGNPLKQYLINKFDECLMSLLTELYENRQMDIRGGTN